MFCGRICLSLFRIPIICEHLLVISGVSKQAGARRIWPPTRTFAPATLLLKKKKKKKKIFFNNIFHLSI